MFGAFPRSPRVGTVQITPIRAYICINGSMAPSSETRRIRAQDRLAAAVTSTRYVRNPDRRVVQVLVVACLMRFQTETCVVAFVACLSARGVNYTNYLIREFWNWRFAIYAQRRG